MLTLFSLFRILRVRRRIATKVNNDYLTRHQHPSSSSNVKRKDTSVVTVIDDSQTTGYKRRMAIVGRVFKGNESQVQEFSRMQPREEKRQKEERYITLSILVVILVFLIAWSPFVVVMLLSTLRKIEIPRWADLGALFLGCMNSTANPMVYLTMNGNFRRTSVALFRKIFKISRSNEDGNAVNLSRA